MILQLVPVLDLVEASLVEDAQEVLNVSAEIKAGDSISWLCLSSVLSSLLSFLLTKTLFCEIFHCEEQAVFSAAQHSESSDATRFENSVGFFDHVH